MRFSLPSSRKTWALLGTGLILVVIVSLGSTAFNRNTMAASMHSAKATVGMDLEQNQVQMNYQLDSSPPPPPPPSANPLTLLPQKLIRTAKLGLEVKDFPRFERTCRDLAQRYGYLADLRINNKEDGCKRAELTLRIAADRFDAALAEFKTLGVVKKEELSVEDVTRAYADLEARRLNKRTAAVRLREIIANRTGKLSDVIEAERALSEVTEELESMEAQKRAMDNQISYSTLRAEVSEPPLPPKFNASALWQPLVTALKDGRSGLISSLAFVLEVLIVLSPWLLLSSLATWLIRRWRAARAREEHAAELP